MVELETDGGYRSDEFLINRFDPLQSAACGLEICLVKTDNLPVTKWIVDLESKAPEIQSPHEWMLKQILKQLKQDHVFISNHIILNRSLKKQWNDLSKYALSKHT